MDGNPSAATGERGGVSVTVTIELVISYKCDRLHKNIVIIDEQAFIDIPNGRV